MAAAAGDRSVGLTWSAPADTGGSAITAYDVRHRAAGTMTWTETADAWETGDGPLEYRVPDLVNGTSYEFIVRAHNADHGERRLAAHTGDRPGDHPGGHPCGRGRRGDRGHPRGVRVHRIARACR